MSKRKRGPFQWKLVWHRAVGEFKNGERRMMVVSKYRPSKYQTQDAARKGSIRNQRAGEPYVGFIYRTRKPKRVTEIQINYPAE